jgi:hypothetical protein
MPGSLPSGPGQIAISMSLIVHPGKAGADVAILAEALFRVPQYPLMLKPRHDLRYTSVHFSRPYPVRSNSNSTNCCAEKDLRACRRRV